MIYEVGDEGVRFGDVVARFVDERYEGWVTRRGLFLRILDQELC
jgi:hypothetical protein